MHLQPVPEGRPDRCSGFDGLQEIPHLDNDLVLITGSVTGALTEGQVIGMCRSGQDLAEAAFRLRPFGKVKPERVLVFLVEADRTFVTVYLVGVTHLPAGGDTADEEMTHRSVLKAAHEMGLVVIGDRLRPVCTGAFGMDGLDIRTNAGDRPGKTQGGVDDVRGEIAHASIAYVLGTPVRRRLRI